MKSGNEAEQTVPELVKLCRMSDVPPGGMKCVRLLDREAIAVYNVDGQFYATEDLCTHGQASLSKEGFLDGYIIECSWHLGSFDVRTGEAVAAPCQIALQTYEIVIEGDNICIRMRE